MNDVDVLILHGAPGSGKSTVSRCLAEQLRVADQANAVIDLDDLCKVHPVPRRSFARENLMAIWPNYAAIPGLKLVIPTVIADADELGRLRESVPGARFAVCELTAPEEILKERVTEREPNEFWQEALRNFVELFMGRSDLASIRDFQVSTYGCSAEESAQEIIVKAGWQG